MVTFTFVCMGCGQSATVDVADADPTGMPRFVAPPANWTEHFWHQQRHRDGIRRTVTFYTHSRCSLRQALTNPTLMQEIKWLGQE